MVVLDLRQVLGIDTSAVKVLAQDAAVRRTGGLSDRFLGSRLEGRGAVAVRRLLGASAETCRVFRELDAALEWCEDRLLEDRIGPEDAKRSAEEWLAHEIGGPEMFGRLAPYLETVSYSAGDVLFVQGDPAEFLRLISSGRGERHSRFAGGI